MIERRDTFHRARELGLTVGKHAESIYYDQGLDLKAALDKALEGKVGKGDYDFDEVRRLAIAHLKARGLVKEPKSEPEKIVIEKPKTPEAPNRLKDLPEKHFKRILDDATEAERRHPADAIGKDEEEI